MSEDSEDPEWEVPKQAQPRDQDFTFNVEETLNSMVLIRSEVPGDAFTAQMLGTERTGNGVVIDDAGLILTVGYVVVEATKIWLTANDGMTVLGDLLAYDYETGFGLVQALGPLGLSAVPIGTAESLDVGESVIFAAAGGRRHAIHAHVTARSPFVASWEYALDRAIFTAPVHLNWAGSGVLDDEGSLVGIGSLFVQNSGLDQVDGNMSVPIDLFKPIAEAMKTTGLSGRPVRPWLGLYAADGEEFVVVAGMVGRGPAAQAGLRVGDEILEVGDEVVSDLHHFYRAVWSQGVAGTEIQLTVQREGKRVIKIRVESAHRLDYMRKPTMQA